MLIFRCYIAKRQPSINHVFHRKEKRLCKRFHEPIFVKVNCTAWQRCWVYSWAYIWGGKVRVGADTKWWRREEHSALPPLSVLGFASKPESPRNPWKHFHPPDDFCFSIICHISFSCCAFILLFNHRGKQIRRKRIDTLRAEQTPIFPVIHKQNKNRMFYSVLYFLLLSSNAEHHTSTSDVSCSTNSLPLQRGQW